MFKVRATYLPRQDMEFDFEYYFRVHVPLAQREGQGRIKPVKIEVETGCETLMAPGEPKSPCVFCIYFAEQQDVEGFRRFLASSGTDPMREDVRNYTNCELEWTVCEVREFAA